MGQLLSPTTPLNVQIAAIERLAEFRDRESTEELLSHWADLTYSVRDAAALQLTANAASTEALVEALESAQFSPAICRYRCSRHCVRVARSHCRRAWAAC